MIISPIIICFACGSLSLCEEDTECFQCRNKDLHKTYFQTEIREHGEVYLPKDESSWSVNQSMSRKLGRLVKILDGVPSVECINPFFITYKYYASAPRRKAYEHRMQLKKSLPKELRMVCKKARRLSKRAFLNEINPETENRIRRLNYQSPGHFWQVCNDCKKPIPVVQMTLPLLISQTGEAQ